MPGRFSARILMEFGTEIVSYMVIDHQFGTGEATDEIGHRPELSPCTRVQNDQTVDINFVGVDVLTDDLDT